MSNNVELRVSQLREDIANGVTRKKGDPGYDASLGSIEEKYNLTKAEVTDIFKHPALQQLRLGTKAKRKTVIIDDVTPVTESAIIGSAPGISSAVTEEPAF